MDTKLEKALQIEREIAGHMIADPHQQTAEELDIASGHTNEEVCRLKACVSELQAALRLVRPYALRWHDQMLTFLVEQAVAAERLEDKQTIWGLYHKMRDERQHLRETMESALARAEEIAPAP